MRNLEKYITQSLPSCVKFLKYDCFDEASMQYRDIIASVIGSWCHFALTEFQKYPDEKWMILDRTKQDYDDLTRGKVRLQTGKMIQELFDYQLANDLKGLLILLGETYLFFVIEIDLSRNVITVSDFVKECYRTCPRCQIHTMNDNLKRECVICKIQYCSGRCFKADWDNHPVCKRKILEEEERTCDYCGNIGKEKAKTCTACKKARYCSQECQRKDWREHKNQCTYKKQRADK